MNNKVIHSVFEEYAVKNPLNIAVETAKEKITYASLNNQANRLADLLRKKGIQKDHIVATFFEEELLQIYALLGVFKSGAIYLPFDKKYKDNHWSQLYSEMHPEFLLTTTENLDIVYHYNSFFDHPIREIITIDIDDNGILNFTDHLYAVGKYEVMVIEDVLSEFNPELIADGDDANYIFFTSGSTGKPKAVLGQHKSLSHFIHWETKELNIQSVDRVGQLTSFSFDASLRDIFVPLIIGATICIPSKEIKEDISQLSNWLAEQGITILHTIPTLFRLLTAIGIVNSNLNKYPQLKYILLAGEKLYNKDIIDWRNAFGENSTIINLYGATESTLVKTFYRVDKKLNGKASDVICAGQPISHTMILILNVFNKLCRVGEVGSIYIRTPFLSKGYYNNDVQTAEKFIQNPLIANKDIIYKTGDYGKYDTDRNVIVLGREDGIVKLNGVRIDINYIESVILESGDIEMVKCMLFEAGTLNASLVCFYTSATTTEKQIRHHCVQRLSQYENPAIVFRLDEFPINANGKADTTALRDSIRKRLSNTKIDRKPVNFIQQKLTEVWEEVLKVDQISIDESFLSLGGNSIKQILLRSKIRLTFNVALSFEDLFRNDTIAVQAELISSYLESEIVFKEDRIKPVPDNKDGYVLSSEQLRIWVTSQSDAESLAHNMSNTYTIHGDLNIQVFKKALQVIVDRHEALRTSFSINTVGDIIQVIHEGVQIEEVFECFLEDNNFSQEQLKETLKKFSGFVFNLACAPLFRILLIELPGNKFCLSTLMHHIIGDYTSDQVIIQELMLLYNGYQNNVPVLLTENAIQYKDYAHWIQQKLSDHLFSDEAAFWSKHLDNTAKLPKWYKITGETDYKGAYYSKTFSDELTSDIRSYCAKTNRNLMGILATALGILIHKVSGQNDIIIGVPVNLRNHPDLTGQVGLYLNLLPFRIKVDQQGTVEDMLADATKNQMKLMDYSFYPFDLIVDEFEEKNKFSLIDRMDVYLNFINHTDEGQTGFENLEIVPQDRELKMSKFPICFYVSNRESNISLRIEYQTKIFEQAEISRLTERFCSCVVQILKAPNQQINAISLVNKKSIPTFSLQ